MQHEHFEGGAPPSPRLSKEKRPMFAVIAQFSPCFCNKESLHITNNGIQEMTSILKTSSGIQDVPQAVLYVQGPQLHQQRHYLPYLSILPDLSSLAWPFFLDNLDHRPSTFLQSHKLPLGLQEVCTCRVRAPPTESSIKVGLKISSIQLNFSIAPQCQRYHGPADGHTCSEKHTFGGSSSLSNRKNVFVLDTSSNEVRIRMSSAV